MEVLLTTVSDNMEYNIIKSLLEAEGIMTMRKMPGTGQYIDVVFGSSYSGIEIYVLESEFERASEILESAIIAGSEIPEEVESFDQNEEFFESDQGKHIFNKKPLFKNLLRIGIILFVLADIIALIIYVYFTYSK